MIRLIIIVLGGILMYVTGSNGEWGPFAVVLVIVLALLGMGAAERKEGRAWWNSVDYWSKDGKDRYKARQRWREEAEREERIAREREAEKRRRKAAKRADQSIAKMQRQNMKSEHWVLCPECRTVMQTLSRKVVRNGVEMSEYVCRECGHRELVKN